VDTVVDTPILLTQYDVDTRILLTLYIQRGHLGTIQYPLSPPTPPLARREDSVSTRPCFPARRPFVADRRWLGGFWTWQRYSIAASPLQDRSTTAPSSCTYAKSLSTYHLHTHSSQRSEDPKTRRRGKFARGEARTFLGKGLCQREELLITRCIPRRTSGSVPRSLCVCVCGGGGLGVSNEEGERELRKG
jgi:hypothetical protein